jgi:hypothetical protein
MSSYLYRNLDTNGDGTGSKDATGDYSSTAAVFYIQPPTEKIYLIERMIVHVEDSGSFDSGAYGNGITLTNGIVVRISDDSGVIVDLTDGMPILSNGSWVRQCYDVQVHPFGSGNEHMGVRWTFRKAGQPLKLVGEKTQKLEIVLNDNFSGLVGHQFQIQGRVTGGYTS